MTRKQRADVKAALKKARMSKAQKEAWKRRKATQIAKSYTVNKEEIDPVNHGLPFDAVRREDPLGTISAQEYINSAATPAERQIRKAEILGLMYGTGPKTFRFDGGKDTGAQLTDRPKTGPYPGSIFKWHLTDKVVEPQAIYGSAESMGEPAQGPQPYPNTNPKTLTGNSKVPVLSVIPPASIIAQATAMRYGAFFAPRTDGTKGYGPYNWRDQPIEAHVYIDAAMRHLMQWFDGDESEIVRDDEGRAIDEVSHLAFALATIGILLDAKANETLIDDRPKARRAAATTLLNSHKLPRYTK